MGSAGIELLRVNGAKIDVTDVLQITPSHVAIQDLKAYLTNAFEFRHAKRHDLQLKQALHKASYLQIQKQRIENESKNVVLTDDVICERCRKRLGTARNKAGKLLIASINFKRLPNGSLIHHACDRYEEIFETELLQNVD